MEKTNKLSKLTWFNIILFGFMGQIAWAIENNFFNVFLVDGLGASHTYIPTMVSASAATAVITTIIMGALSDKIGKRKPLLSIGYIIWGISVGVFALISRENISKIFNVTDTATIVFITAMVVVVMDCVMTFFGSAANDAAFNAWVTDITSVKNRGTVEAVLGILPIFATVIVSVGVVGIVSGANATPSKFAACLLVLGAVVTICGIIGLFTLKEPENISKSNESYFKDLVYGFKPSIIKENKNLYIVLCAACIFNTAVQVWMPYIFLYLEHSLGFNLGALNITPPFIIIALVAVVGVVAAFIGMGKLVDKIGKTQFVLASAIAFIVGLVLVSFAKTIAVFLPLAIIMLGGYGLLMIILNASVRDFTPQGMSGRFQGVRMLFVVFIPMVIGSNVGSEVINRFHTETYINSYGEVAAKTCPEIFLAAAIISVVVFIPLLAVRKHLNKVNF